jgi:hypothetical protein
MADEEFSAASQQVPMSFQALTDAAYRAANSLSAISTNAIGQTAQAQGFANGVPATPPGMPPFAAYGAFQAAMYGAQASPFSPQASIARDMFASQMAMMGPMGMGAAGGAGNLAMPGGIATPFGDPTVNPFLRAGAANYQLPTPLLAGAGAPGQPFDPVRSRFLMGTGEGSLLNSLYQMGIRSATGGVVSDNLEDPIRRKIERMQEYTADNLYRIGMGGAGLAASFGGAGLGAMAGAGLSTGLLGGAAALPLGLAGGLVGGLVAPMAIDYLDRRASVYRTGAREMRDYMTPYVRGDRLGGGLTMRETQKLTRDLEHTVAKDQFFTAEDYRTLIGMAGETGMFQFAGDKEQAMKSLENMSKSVKTLFALGVSSRDQLGQISIALNQFGVSAASNPQQLANVFQTFAGYAQSAGMSLPQLTQAAAPAAQMFAAQGIGPLAGATIAGQNLGLAGAYFRSGGSAFDNAYFGGSQGFAQSLTNATGSMLRSPLGQFMTASAMAPGSGVMGNILSGRGTSALDFVNSMGGYAMDPLGYLGQQARMPELTQGLGGVIQPAVIESALATYREMFKVEGPIDADHFLGFLMRMGVAENEALAMVKAIQKMPQLAADMRRSARDQSTLGAIERRRQMSVSRRVEKFMERNLDPIATGLTTGARELSLDALDGTANFLSNVSRATGFGNLLSGSSQRYVGGRTYEELMTGTQRADVGAMGYLFDANETLKREQETYDFTRAYNQGRQPYTESAAAEQRKREDRELRAAMRDPEMRASARRVLNNAGATPQEISDLIRRTQRSDVGAVEFEQAMDRSDALRLVYNELRQTAVPEAYGSGNMARYSEGGANVGAREAMLRVQAMNALSEHQTRDKTLIQAAVQLEQGGGNRAFYEDLVGQMRYREGGAKLEQRLGSAANRVDTKLPADAQRQQYMANLVGEFSTTFEGKDLNAVRADPALASKLAALLKVGSDNRVGGNENLTGGFFDIANQKSAFNVLVSENVGESGAARDAEGQVSAMRESLSRYQRSWTNWFPNAAMGRVLNVDNPDVDKFATILKDVTFGRFVSEKLSQGGTLEDAKKAWMAQGGRAESFEGLVQDLGITAKDSVSQVRERISARFDRGRGLLKTDAQRKQADDAFISTMRSGSNLEDALALFKYDVNRSARDATAQVGFTPEQEDRFRGALRESNVSADDIGRIVRELPAGNLSGITQAMERNPALRQMLGSSDQQQAFEQLVRQSRLTPGQRDTGAVARALGTITGGTYDEDFVRNKAGNLDAVVSDLLMQALGGPGSGTTGANRFASADEEGAEVAQASATKAQLDVARRYDDIAKQLNSERIEKQQTAINNMVAAIGGTDGGLIKSLQKLTDTGLRVTGEVNIKMNGQDVGVAPLKPENPPTP